MALAKQVIVVRKDLQMSKGKMAAQVAHASLGALFRELGIGKFATPVDGTTYKVHIPQDSALDLWLNESFTKVVLEIENEQAMAILQLQLMMQDKIPYSIIVDEGRTEFNSETLTCIGIGPAFSEDIDEFTGHLKLYNDPLSDYNKNRLRKTLQAMIDELDR